MLAAEALSNALKTFVRDHFVTSITLAFEGYVLNFEGSDSPTLEKWRALLEL